MFCQLVEDLKKVASRYLKKTPSPLNGRSMVVVKGAYCGQQKNKDVLEKDAQHVNVAERLPSR